MENNRQICTDYVSSLFKSGRPHFPMEIQENVIMTPTLKPTSLFVNMNFKLILLHITLQLRNWQFLQQKEYAHF